MSGRGGRCVGRTEHGTRAGVALRLVKDGKGRRAIGELHVLEVRDVCSKFWRVASGRAEGGRL